MSAILSLEKIRVAFARQRDLFGRPVQTLRALDDVSVSVGAGECVGIVGESGSGKSTLASVAIGLVQPDSGEVRLSGEGLAARVEDRKSAEKRAIQIVFQDPNSSLDPTMPLWRIVSEGLAINSIGGSDVWRARATGLLGEVGLDQSFGDRKPHQLSGGQRQRVAIARALAVEPTVLLLDEPTSALDVSVQAQILNLLLALQQKRGLSYLFISHDLEVIRHMCHRIYVMRAGKVIEKGETTTLFSAPTEAYTRSLIAAIPRIGS